MDDRIPQGRLTAMPIRTTIQESLSLRIMQAFVSILTAALLFIHTVFGCCWHHEHCSEHGSSVAVNQSAKCCHHHQHGSDSKQQEKPGKCKVECAGACIYVVPPKVTVEAPQSISF